jgi:hypothetical protein
LNSGEASEPPPLGPGRRVAHELVPDEVERSVRLPRARDVKPDRPRHEVRELEADRVRALVRDDDVEREGAPLGVVAAARPPEGPLELAVLVRPPRLDDDVRGRRRVVVSMEPCVQALEAEAKARMVEVLDRRPARDAVRMMSKGAGGQGMPDPGRATVLVARGPRCAYVRPPARDVS